MRAVALSTVAQRREPVSIPTNWRFIVIIVLPIVIIVPPIVIIVPPIVIIGLDPRIIARTQSAQFELLAALRPMLGSSPSMTAGEVCMRAEGGFDHREALS